MCLLLFAAGVVRAEVTDDFTYDSHGKRDPLIPWKSEPQIQEAEDLTDLKIEGIIFDPERGSYAILNGNVVREGESLGAYRLSRIEKKKVILLRHSKEIELPFEPEE